MLLDIFGLAKGKEPVAEPMLTEFFDFIWEFIDTI